ncbi:hypothetical protein COX00_00315 [Candidatus Uhrbacteria bacterium CG22_combo_CG10-13_8_21_14_all_47_17]|uniref:Uncharacterized protein n=1 Tax=Candidatus Uhrbacteria bacterium CG22_combo_CG10-13_8_21_14_all_47_17 TaxID=1975041 RepID=A0A2H0BTH5_9BACT|nr:MAG: hypothetical protein COX00_00315 [Candidatus Uhrbacteria bacterium CG22_combo_CG10-13_8_21_14_all_47_17]
MPQATVFGPGSPEKACDLIATAIVEEYVKRDPNAKVDIRVSGGYGALFVSGEAKSEADFDISTAVKRTAAQIDPRLALEPFVAIEPALLARGPISIFGYATSETDSFLPPAVDEAMHIARELERFRTVNEDGFWLSGDYDVTVTREGKERIACIQVSHMEEKNVEDVRAQITDIASHVFEGGLRINPNGADHRQGLQKRVGSSGRLTQEWFGAKLPSSATGIGFELKHPSNLGRWFARAAAKELVIAKKGKAVFVEMQWLPLETKPRILSARNERGEILSSYLDRDRFDLTAPPEAWTAPELLSGEAQFLTNNVNILPWEKELQPKD